MTNPILEFLRADSDMPNIDVMKATFRAQDPIKQLVLDYAMMRDALRSNMDSISIGVQMASNGTFSQQRYAYNKMEQAKQAVATAETHRELLEAVREGM